MRRAILFAGLSTLALLVSARADEAAPEEAKAAAAADALALNPLAGLDKATLEGFREAPLFTPSRTRPTPPPPPVAEAPPPPPPPEEEPPPEPPTLKIAGIVAGPDGAVAFVSKEGEEEVEQLRLGDQIDGWLVTAIDFQALKLTLDEREQEYRLFVRPDDGSATSGDDAGNDGDGSDSSDEDAAASDDDSSANRRPKPAQQKSGAAHEMEAARKAQRDSRRRPRDNGQRPPQQQD
ncbi:hypothetical protein IHQ68_09580 [Chelatococcus sambhunathii]|uniref:General secretion pathway protein N n=1 Tax=Chelatococcus sambhunathii TaxID=363953 RepID=A0ABU1DFR2_9HYPH|nr:hypothetical protein [Chelatococcus sambhunathii]MDR4306868.1 hypothetical protein [Chelatococcus sambhunathii]